MCPSKQFNLKKSGSYLQSGRWPATIRHKSQSSETREVNQTNGKNSDSKKWNDPHNRLYFPKIRKKQKRFHFTHSYSVALTLLPLRGGILCSLFLNVSGLWHRPKGSHMTSDASSWGATWLLPGAFWTNVLGTQPPCSEKAQAATWRV